MADNFYIRDGNIIAKRDLEIYLPISYFEIAGTEDFGHSIQCLGILPYSAIVEGKPEKIQLIKIPTLLILNKYDFRLDTIKLISATDDVITLMYPQDSIIGAASVVKSGASTSMFVNYLLKGKLPTKLVAYDDIFDLLKMNLNINSINLGMPDSALEILIANLCRYKGDRTKRFATVYGKSDTVSPYDYVIVSTRELTKLLSTFSGISFENIKPMLTNGIIRSRKGMKEPVSPIEAVIKM
jgi:hypothetical protein